MPKKRKLCFVLADGGHARFVRPAADFSLHTVKAVDSADAHKRDHDLVSDRPGRSFESGTTGRHAYSPRHDPHEMAKERFAHEVGRMVNLDAVAEEFSDLAVVAPSPCPRRTRRHSGRAGEDEIAWHPGEGSREDARSRIVAASEGMGQAGASRLTAANSLSIARR